MPRLNPPPREHDHDPLEVIVHGRVQRELRRLGGTLDPSPAFVRSVHTVLYRPELTDEEETAYRKVVASQSSELLDSDPIGVVLSLRVGAALSVGHALACKELGLTDVGPPSAVLVLRKCETSQTNDVNKQIADAMAHVRPRLEGASHSPEGDSTLFLLAHEQAFQRLRRFLPSSDGARHARIVFYTREESQIGVASSPSSDVEVVEVDRELGRLETHITVLLDASARRNPVTPRALDGSPRPSAEPAESIRPVARRGDTFSNIAHAPETPPAPAVDDALIGTLFHHKYRILSKIGVGGFGSVYEARDERGAGNRVAIKILRPDLATNPILVTAFRNEARRVTRLGHPNIVDWKVFDETEDRTRYFVMELVEGEELDRVLAREGPLEPRRVAKILLQILDALRAAHHLGEGETILHLDLKPRNVFLVPARSGREEQVKVIDFGIGQYIGEEADEEDLPDLDADTSHHAAPGDTPFHATSMRFRIKEPMAAPKGFRRCSGCTPEYASPEQSAHVLGLPDITALDARSDLYSLGVMAFQMLTGHLPFTRPLSRGDMLRLHLQRPPRKVGAMGVKVPRALARFVDRCLAKDRDARFPDTHAAHRAMERIVHPPIAKRVALIVAPLIVLAFAIGAAIMRGGEQASVGLTFDGAELGPAQPIYLGPARTEAVLQPTGDAPLGEFRTARLVAVEGGAALDGWTVTKDAANGVRITAPTSAPGNSSEKRVRLELDGSDVRLRDFTLVWLGPDAWRVERATIGDVGAAELGARAIDPLDLNFDVKIGGPRRGDIESVSVRVGERAPLSLPVNVRQGELDVYSVALGRLELASGPTAIEIAVADKAGRRVTQSVSLDIQPLPIAVRAVELRDGASGAEPAASPSCNRIGEGWLLSPRTKPILWIELDRAAALSWSIEAEGGAHATLSHTEPPARLHAPVLDGLAALATDGRFRGRIRYRLDDSAAVLHASGSQRGIESGFVPFELSNLQPEIDLRLTGADDVGRYLASGETGYVKKPDIDLAVVRKTRVPLKLLLTWKREDDDGTGERLEKNDLRDLGKQESAFHFTLPGEGVYALLVQAFQYDSQAEAAADRPDLEARLTIVFDTSSPRAVLEGLAAGLVLTSAETAMPEVALVLDGASRGSPIEAKYELTRAGEAVPLKSGNVASDLHDGERRTFRMPDVAATGDADGDYVLSVRCQDQAGNRAQPLDAAFTIARSGPTLALEAPTRGGEWQAGAANRWTVQVRAEDRNGVQTVECTASRKGAETVRLPIPLSNAGEDAWTGALTFPHEWSGADVSIHLRARDKFGIESVRDFEGYRLPNIRPPRPAQVAAKNGASMRLVEGNDGFPYSFGGQGDEAENRLFREAGLNPFNPNRGKMRDLSWQVRYEPGEIGDFYLDEYEVSVGEFLTFVRAKDGWVERSRWPAGATSAADATRQRGLDVRLSALPADQPVNEVAWDEAAAFAAWSGKRLPSWVEWEYAVRGGSQCRPFAAWDPAKTKPDLNVGAGASGAPRRRGDGDDVTLDTRIRDLTGNLAEWTSTPVAVDETGRTSTPVSRHALENRTQYLAVPNPQEITAAAKFWLAGGSFADQRHDFSVAEDRGRTWRSAKAGFRCAASLADVRRAIETGAFQEIQR